MRGGRLLSINVVYCLVALGLASRPAVAAQPSGPPGDSKAAADDDAEPGATETATTVVVDAPRGDTTVVAVSVRDPVEHGRIEGRHRLHIDTDIFAWRRAISWSDQPDVLDGERERQDTFNLIGGAPILAVGGVGPPGNFGLGYGYGVTDKVVIGARLGLGWQHRSTPEPDGAASSSLGYWFSPYFEYVFRPGTRVRPFLGARLGLTGSVGATRTGDMVGRVGTIGPIFGAGVGVHAFVTERVSIDPGITFDYALLWSRAAVTPMPTGAEPEPFERAAQVPNLAAMISLSVWLGRDDRR